jgi:hypothetical protein
MSYGSNQDLLNRKMKQVRQELEEWVKSNLKLTAGQQVNVAVTATIKPGPLVVAKGKVIRKGKDLNPNLQDDDWTKLLSLDLTQDERHLVELCRRDNKLRTLQDLQSELPPEVKFGYLISPLNRKLEARRTSYRFRGRTGLKHRVHYQFVILVNVVGSTSS